MHHMQMAEQLLPPAAAPARAASPAKTAPPLYASVAGEAALRRHYDAGLAALKFPHEERQLDTPSFGRAHVTVCGPLGAPPLLLWHGTASPAPFMLPTVPELVERFRVYCPDIPCQGKWSAGVKCLCGAMWRPCLAELS